MKWLPDRKCLAKVTGLAGMGLVLMAVLAILFHVQLLTGLARFLIVEEPLHPADIIFVLNGDVDSRPFLAGELFRQGLAPRIVMAQAEDTPPVEMGLFPNTTDVAVQVMQELGVPEDCITVVLPGPEATSTRDESAILRAYVEQQAVQRVILVTTAFHTRRARWIFEKNLAGSAVTLQVAAAPHPSFDHTNWWQHESGLITCLNEYIKLAYYWLAYR